MVKSKKDKKEVEMNASSSEDEMNVETDTKKSKKPKKPGKQKKSSKGDYDQDAETILDDVEKLNIDTDETENDVEKNKSKKKKNKKPKKNGFELLMDNENDIEETKPISDEDNNSEIKVEKENLENDDKTKKEKKSKKSKKKKNQEDEDIDSILAELEMEYSGVKVEPKAVISNINEESNIKKKKEKIAENDLVEENMNKNEGEEDEGVAIKSAAQKKKEKKERQKREAALAKKKAIEKEEKETTPQSDANVESLDTKEEITEHQENHEQDIDESKKDDKKKKKKGKKDKEEEKEKEKEKKKGINKAMVAAMQERLKKIKEEEERLLKEEEERLRQEEERERLRLEQIRLEQERKERKKQKEAERKARLKAEGKLLTKKQKEDLAKAKAMIEARKAQGLDIPDPNEKRTVRLGTRIRPNKKKEVKKKDDNNEEKLEDKIPVEEDVKQTTPIPESQEEIDEVKDAWDETSSDSEEDSKEKDNSEKIEPKVKKNKELLEKKDESDEESITENSSREDSVEENKNDTEFIRERAAQRIEKRRIDSEQKRTANNLREAVVCVLGHVDTGKTKILDKLRRTHVQDSEAGGITQQIGATNVPIDAIKEQTKVVKASNELQFKLPGLLIIDTPGHESFSNLRNRGSSLCDIAILVVDIMHGLEPQTIESINLLKSKKCPFIVALNKIDRLYDWQTIPRKDVRDVIKAQQINTQAEFTERTKKIILEFAEQGLNAALFYENPDPRSYVSLVPTSAITGEGMGNLLYLIVESCQTLLAKRLMYSEELQAIVLEVKAISGLGTTIDTILINGRLKEGDTIIIAGTDGPIVTQIRSLLMPQPLKELRVKNAYKEHKEVKAAQGVKITAKDLEKAIAGINLLVAHKPDEIEICKEEVAKELKNALSHIKLSERGVYVQASTLGSLEALLDFLKSSKISYSGIRIGPVVKKDVMKASVMLEHDPQYATILAFDVKVERDAQELADSLGVKIFQADIIYHLFDKFTAYREELKQKKRDEFKSIAVFPCKLKILPQFVFNTRDPIVIGVIVENGILKEGTPLCVPSKEFVDIGIVTSIESNHKQIESARKGQEICIKIDPLPGESPKMYGRHFDAEDMLVSKISRQSIDACKEYFRDDLIKADWQLIVELKKLFEIL